MNTEYTQFVATLLKQAGKVKLYQPGKSPISTILYGIMSQIFMDRTFKRLQTPQKDDKILTKTNVK